VTQWQRKETSKMGWKIYFWVILALLVAAYAIDPTYFNFFDYLDIPVSFISVAGLFGYAYKKRIVHYDFWKIWLIVLIGWDIVYNYFLAGWIKIEEAPMSSVLIDNMWGLSIFIPEYIALYLYGFRSKRLWEGEVVRPPF
jgi:hypothetical protein